MRTKIARASTAAGNRSVRTLPLRRRHDGLAPRRGMGRAAPPRFAERSRWADRAAADAFAVAIEEEIELDPGFDDIESLDGQVDILFGRNRREAVVIRFADDGDVA